jgi:hypothetical protein
MLVKTSLHWSRLLPLPEYTIRCAMRLKKQASDPDLKHKRAARNCTSGSSQILPIPLPSEPLAIASVLVRLNPVASRIVNANHLQNSKTGRATEKTTSRRD